MILVAISFGIILKLNNQILEKKFVVKNILANVAMLNYTKNVD